MSDRCTSYCVVNCINGYCPNANCDGFVVRSYCDVCPYYEGCDDCAFFDTDYCSKSNFFEGCDFMIGASGSILLRQLDTLTLSEACLFSVVLLLILFLIVKGLTK